MKLFRLFTRLIRAMFDLFCIALMFIGAAMWVSVKFLTRYAYEILFVFLLLRLGIFILVLLTILFGLKRR